MEKLITITITASSEIVDSITIMITLTMKKLITITITASSEIVDYDYTDHEKADYDYDYRLLAEIDYNDDYRSVGRQCRDHIWAFMPVTSGKYSKIMIVGSYLLIFRPISLHVGTYLDCL